MRRWWPFSRHEETNDLLVDIQQRVRRINRRMNIVMTSFQSIEDQITSIKTDLATVSTDIATIIANLPPTGGLTADQVTQLASDLGDVKTAADALVVQATPVQPPAPNPTETRPPR